MGQFILSGARWRLWQLFLVPGAAVAMGVAKAPERMLRENIFIVPRSARMM